jgi:hypothetical protein
VLNSSFVHLMKFSAENPRLRKAAIRYKRCLSRYFILITIPNSLANSFMLIIYFISSIKYSRKSNIWFEDKSISPTVVPINF